MAALVSSLVVLVAVPAALGGDDARRPTLKIVDLSPVTVLGTGFRPGERVTLLVGSPRPLSKSVKAGRRGVFTARFTLRAGHGEAVVVQAIGARGSRAHADVTMPHGSRP